MKNQLVKNQNDELCPRCFKYKENVNFFISDETGSSVVCGECADEHLEERASFLGIGEINQNK